MIVRKIVLAFFCLVAIPALAASSLPPKMEGQRHTNGGRTNKVEAELIQMESPNTAKIKATYWDGCTRSGETSAEFKDDAWQFTIPGGGKCDDVIVVVRPVDGKNRLEGEFKTGKWNGSIYFEW
jgi:hypothetical protein